MVVKKGDCVHFKSPLRKETQKQDFLLSRYWWIAVGTATCFINKLNEHLPNEQSLFNNVFGY